MSVQDSRRADAESTTTTANEHVGSHLGKVFGVSVLAALIVSVVSLLTGWLEPKERRRVRARAPRD